MYRPYTVCYGTSLGELKASVKVSIDLDYVPLGGIIIVKEFLRKRRYYQAMVRRSVFEKSNTNMFTFEITQAQATGER